VQAWIPSLTLCHLEELLGFTETHPFDSCVRFKILQIELHCNIR